jgi:Subtilase family
VPLEFPRRARVSLAVTVAAACLALSATPVFAGSVRGQEWWLHGLHVPRAWQSTRAGGITVAVLDTGVDTNQADLTGAVTQGPDYSNSGRLPGGPYWGVHGTAMASLIAGRGHGPNQADGIVGIAPAATILSIRVTLESNDPLLADANIAAGLPGAIAKGIRYAVKHGAAVIDLPLDPVTAPGASGAGGSPAERSAVDYALAHRVVLVAPAGDDVTGSTADPVNFPAAYPGVISVGAFNSTFTKAAFSSQQPYVTLTAAGDGVVAADGLGGYTQINSTSAASAVVAGIVALIRAQFPALSPAQVTKALTQGTVYRPPGGQNTGSGAGTVDAARALTAAAGMIEAVPTPSVSPTATPAVQAPPPAPPVHTKSRSLRSTLIIYAVIAMVVFLLLAVPILAYGRLRRRRARAKRLAEVRAAAQVPVRRAKQAAPAATGEGAATRAGTPAGVGAGPAAGAVTGHDDYTAAPHIPGFPASVSSVGPAAEARTRAGENGFPGSAFPGNRPGPASAGGGRPAGPAGPPVPGAAAARAIGSHRLGLARPPKISGNPPWEPAPEPSGEVPWGRAPAPAGGAGLTPAAGSGPGSGPPAAAAPAPEPAVPELSPWDAVAQEAWPGGPRPLRPPASGTGTNGSGGRAGDSGGGHDGDDQAERPIYVWNPGASTESFPAMPADDPDEPRP